MNEEKLRKLKNLMVDWRETQVMVDEAAERASKRPEYREAFVIFQTHYTVLSAHIEQIEEILNG